MQMRQNDVKFLSILCISLITVCTMGIVIDSDESDAVTDLGTYTGGNNNSSPSAAYSSVNGKLSIDVGVETIYVFVGSSFNVEMQLCIVSNLSTL